MHGEWLALMVDCCNHASSNPPRCLQQSNVESSFCWPASRSQAGDSSPHDNYICIEIDRQDPIDTARLLHRAELDRERARAAASELESCQKLYDSPRIRRLRLPKLSILNNCRIR